MSRIANPANSICSVSATIRSIAGSLEYVISSQPGIHRRLAESGLRREGKSRFGWRELRWVCATLLVPLAIPFSASQAAIVISSGSTHNMTCSSGVCSPTAHDAVLNVSDLENLLAAGNVSITTTASGVQADDIELMAAFGWSNASSLSMDAYESIQIDSAVAVAGSGGLSLLTNDGGSGGAFSISRKGNIVFSNLSSQLTINGTSYLLLNSLSAIASAIASNPGGAYALASSYDASGDGTYTSSPIQTNFTGALDGLGNAITNLSIRDDTPQNSVGLFYLNSGTIQHLGVLHVDIVASGNDDDVGVLAGGDEGLLFEDVATGRIRARGDRNIVGGLAGYVVQQSLIIDQSFADVRIDASDSKFAYVGGLAGVLFDGSIEESFSTGDISVGRSVAAAGLVGYFLGEYEWAIADSYSTGSVSGGTRSKVGGFVGLESSSRLAREVVITSYSTGTVSGGKASEVGGFGGKSGNAKYGSDYWDTTTSGTTQAIGKGHSGHITGLTTQQLQSGLPKGFDHRVWGEKSRINNGLPYLLNNPPPR